MEGIQEQYDGINASYRMVCAYAQAKCIFCTGSDHFWGFKILKFNI